MAISLRTSPAMAALAAYYEDDGQSRADSLAELKSIATTLQGEWPAVHGDQAVQLEWWKMLLLEAQSIPQ